MQLFMRMGIPKLKRLEGGGPLTFEGDHLP